MKSLDDEVMWLALDRVGRGTITVQHDEFRRQWYYEDGRQCLFATRLLDVLTEQGYIYWDSMIGETGRLRVRQDGIWAVRLDNWWLFCRAGRGRSAGRLMVGQPALPDHDRGS